MIWMYKEKKSRGLGVQRTIPDLIVTNWITLSKLTSLLRESRIVPENKEHRLRASSHSG
jgi:hypothetical protein